jgi:hypothetical protein
MGQIDRLVPALEEARERGILREKERDTARKELAVLKEKFESNYSRDDEMRQIRRRYAVCVCVLVRTCMYVLR